MSLRAELVASLFGNRVEHCSPHGAIDIVSGLAGVDRYEVWTLEMLQKREYVEDLWVMPV